MSQDRRFGYLNQRKIIYRQNPITDIPSQVFKWGSYYEDGTYQCYELFRSKAKITTYKSLKWHLLVIWYLNPSFNLKKFTEVASYICDKENGFIQFYVPLLILEKIIVEVSTADLDQPPKNKLRKIIFKDNCTLSLREKLRIVGHIIGKTKKVNESDIYESMLFINETHRKITISNLSKALGCSTRTIYRTMSDNLKKEKMLLNKEYEKI
jgi:hypothetical protein|tara:strand:- start:1094 stop:1723 length:630 start_codon:yes stop_codon:yes gene_type:complete